MAAMLYAALLELLMHLLPPGLKHVFDCTDKKESGTRWTVGGIHLELKDDDKFVAVATNTKVLVIVEGQGDTASDYPETQAMLAAPNGATTSLVPGKIWKEAFSETAVLTKGATKPILKNVAVKLGENEVSFSSTDNRQSMFKQSPPLDGRFPPYQEIWPRRKPRVKFFVDGKLLGELCKSVCMIANSGDKPGDYTGVSIELSDPYKPIVIRPMMQNKKYETKALIMPLAGDKPTSKDDDTVIRSDPSEEMKEVRTMIQKVRLRLLESSEDSSMRAIVMARFLDDLEEHAKKACPRTYDSPVEKFDAEPLAVAPEDNPADEKEAVEPEENHERPPDEDDEVVMEPTPIEAVEPLSAEAVGEYDPLSSFAAGLAAA